MRGEHRPNDFAVVKKWGSSPHARGARLAVAHQVPEDGIIPACAGSTPSLAGLHAATGDHPRMRGEHPAITPAAQT